MTKKIYQWDEIKESFEDSTLILGNGASRNVSEKFSYNSLKEEAERLGILNNDVIKLFGTFNTVDFELILRTLWYANLVNKDLGIPENKSTEAYKSISLALVKLVREVHSDYSNINFKNIGDFIKRFSFIFPLSYDLIVYWTILYLNEKESLRNFKDCFGGGGIFNNNLHYYRKKNGEITSHIVAYPHGMLAINMNRLSLERKLSSSAREWDEETTKKLLDLILHNWINEQNSPVFVSEGTSEKKVEAIHRSRYLTAIFDDFLPNALLENRNYPRKNPKNLTIFGWAFGEHDEHIIKSMLSKCFNKQLDNMKIAVSVNPSSTQQDLEELFLNIKKIFKVRRNDNSDQLWRIESVKGLEIYPFAWDSVGNWKNN
ncbi:DUF4917 family protein [Acinetobacter soli]|uniref:DUF4917 family protein n=1 Tax=Acinetobacter soli TaxID=487316 RepID=UPI001ABC3FF1|nr:DUF4917 family protein [Acinetobacter soli]MBO3672766.1 DUF4917 family protein [Acinetobacter soli]